MHSEDTDEQLSVWGGGEVDAHWSQSFEPSENISVHDCVSIKSKFLEGISILELINIPCLEQNNTLQDHISKGNNQINHSICKILGFTMDAPRVFAEDGRIKELSPTNYKTNKKIEKHPKLHDRLSLLLNQPNHKLYSRSYSYI